LDRSRERGRDLTERRHQYAANPGEAKRDQKRGHTPPGDPKRRLVASSSRFPHQAPRTDAFLAYSLFSTRARRPDWSFPRHRDPRGPVPMRCRRANQLSSYLIIWFRYSGTFVEWALGTTGEVGEGHFQTFDRTRTRSHWPMAALPPAGRSSVSVCAAGGRAP
jgi:hypothetical protein